MPRGKVKDRDGIYQRKDRPGWWASWVDAGGKRRQRKLDVHTLQQARTGWWVLYIDPSYERVHQEKVLTKGKHYVTD